MRKSPDGSLEFFSFCCVPSGPERQTADAGCYQVWRCNLFNGADGFQLEWRALTWLRLSWLGDAYSRSSLLPVLPFCRNLSPLVPCWTKSIYKALRKSLPFLHKITCTADLEKGNLRPFFFLRNSSWRCVSNNTVHYTVLHYFQGFIGEQSHIVLNN